MRTICGETAGGIRLIFIVDDNFLLRITHELSNGGQAFCERTRPRNERKIRKRRRPIDRNDAVVNPLLSDSDLARRLREASAQIVAANDETLDWGGTGRPVVDRLHRSDRARDEAAKLR
jgi:hypothetical protein